LANQCHVSCSEKIETIGFWDCFGDHIDIAFCQMTRIAFDESQNPDNEVKNGEGSVTLWLRSMLWRPFKRLDASPGRASSSQHKESVIHPLLRNQV
jgi:hypothetical protein